MAVSEGGLAEVGRNFRQLASRLEAATRSGLKPQEAAEKFIKIVISQTGEADDERLII